MGSFRCDSENTQSHTQNVESDGDQRDLGLTNNLRERSDSDGSFISENLLDHNGSSDAEDLTQIGSKTPRQ